jgi:toxin ParE1/3/4
MSDGRVGSEEPAGVKQYRVSDVARADLDDIWFYIAQDDPDAADGFIRTIVSRFPTLASMPYLGRAREDLSAGLRSFPVQKYIIFYRPREGGVEIVRVLSGARDLPPLF